MIKFEKGDKIEIFDDYYIIGKVTKTRVELETNDPSFFESYLEISKKGIILFTNRKIDCKITHRGIRYNGKSYQIIKQYQENRLEDKKWKRYRIHEIHFVKEMKKDMLYPRRVVVDEEGNFIFENWQIVKEEDIIFEPEEKFAEPIEKISKKFVIKYKEKP